MEVTFGAIGGIEDIVDHELGLSDYLPVSKVRVVDSRFGIDLPVDLGSDHGRIQIRPNSNRKCNTVIQIDDGDVVSLEGLMKTPGIPNLPADKFKLVVDTWCFTSIVSADGKLSVKFKDLWNEKLPIDNAFTMMKLFSWSGQEITIKFAGEDIPPLSFTGQFFSTHTWVCSQKCRQSQRHFTIFKCALDTRKQDYHLPIYTDALENFRL